MRKHLKSFSLIAFGLAATASWAAPMTAAKLDSLNERLDSLEAYAGSTVVGKDDNPVAVSGDIAIRFKNFDYYEYSDLQKDDRVRTKVEAAATVGVVVSPASYLTVFTNLYLPFDFSGYLDPYHKKPNFTICVFPILDGQFTNSSSSSSSTSSCIPFATCLSGFILF